MAIDIQDILKVNVIFVGIGLLDEPASLEGFRNSVGSEVVPEGVIFEPHPGGAPMQGQILRLAKDRIFLESSPFRTLVNRDYPTQDGLERLAEIVASAIENTNLEARKPRAFGFNIELVFDQASENSALSYLANRIFSPNISGTQGWQLMGGAGKLIFKENAHRWTVRIEPRLNEEMTTKVFLALNFHINEERLPEKAEIHNLLLKTWEQAHNFVNRIDDNVGS